MAENGVFNKLVDMTEPNSGNPFNTNLITFSSPELNVLNNRDRLVSGYAESSNWQDNIYDSQPFIHDSRISDSYVSRNVLPERDHLGVFPYDASYPTRNIHVPDRYMDGMPLSAASIATILSARFDALENGEQSASSVPLPYPLEVPNSIVPNDNYEILNSSSHTTMRYGHDGLVAVSGSKWDFTCFDAHPELVGISGGRTDLRSFDSPSGSSRLSNELSLSLATSNPSIVHHSSIQDQCSEIYCSNSPHERCIGSEQTSCGRNLSLRFGSCGPVQLSQFLSDSRYIRVMQEILAEIADYSLGNVDLTSTPAIGIEDQAYVSFSSSCTAGECYPDTITDDLTDASHGVANQVDPMLQCREVERKKKKLLALLQVVDDRYNECLDEIHTVISAFHAATELYPPIHARFVLHTISMIYKNLRERISNHILAMGAPSGLGVARKDEKSFEASFIQKQWALQQLRRKDNQLWRPQRGLPERSVSVLRAWMFQNFLHPYPKDAEKHLLAVKSGLTRNQVSNWFINARVRLWKPMIEEMYSEMNRRKSRNLIDEETNSQQQTSLISMDNSRFSMH